MAISDYNPNIPQASDQFSVSQGQLLLNFGALQQWLAVNHVDYATSGAGKHKWVSLPVQAAAPPVGAFSTNEVGLYSFLNPTTNRNELYVSQGDNPATQVPMTASGQVTDGWTYLPSGIILKWGKGNTGLTGEVTVTPSQGPAFTNIFNAQVTRIVSSLPYGDFNGVAVRNITGTTFVVGNQGTEGNNQQFYYYAIGN